MGFGWASVEVVFGPMLSERLGAQVVSVEEEAESVGRVLLMATCPLAYVHAYGKELAQRAS